MKNIEINKMTLKGLIESRKMLIENVLKDYDLSGDLVQFNDLQELKSLSEKLAVPLKDFFNESDLDRGVKIGRKDNAFSRTANRNGTKYYTYNHLATTKDEPNLMALRVEVHCKDAKNVELNGGHGSKEIVYVTKGKIRFDWEENDKKHNAELAVGDSVYVSPFIPHSFMALEDGSELIAVNY